MTARMKNPAMVLDGAMKAIYGLVNAVNASDVPVATLDLVHLRASQINGCGYCVDIGVKTATKNGESDERLHGVAAWREMPYYTDAERSALALTESVTRLADRSNAVPDEIWDEAAQHFNESELAAILVHVATTNLYNRLNVPTRQPAGA